VPGFLLDTNVISELVKRAPDQRVLRWVASQAPLDLYLSAVTIGELTQGVAKLPAGSRRDELARWIQEDLQQQFSDRILAFDQQAAVIWGNIVGDAERQGRPRAAIDAQLAATAIRHGLTLATRNTADFDATGAQLTNPWAG
jgi:predicted nucleic acid-binding protein